MRLKCINSVSVSGRTVYREGEIYHGVRNENGSIEIRSSVGTGFWSEYEPAFAEHFKILPEIEEDVFNKGEPYIEESTVTKESATVVPKPEPSVVQIEKPKKKENKVLNLFKKLF